MAVMSIISFTTVARLISASLLFTIVYTFLLTIYRLFFSPLAKIPGPWLTRISSVQEASALKRNQRTLWVQSLFDENPEAVAVRTGPNSVSFNHPDAVKAIYGTSRSPWTEEEIDKS